MRGSFYTPTYRPPELFQLSICQTSADVYALGLLVSLLPVRSDAVVLIPVDAVAPAVPDAGKTFH